MYKHKCDGNDNFTLQIFLPQKQHFFEKEAKKVFDKHFEFKI